jgi:hypothetical protein
VKEPAKPVSISPLMITLSWFDRNYLRRYEGPIIHVAKPWKKKPIAITRVGLKAVRV